MDAHGLYDYVVLSPAQHDGDRRYPLLGLAGALMTDVVSVN